nr:HlyD family efflux transporter periplasmic adaptor subunit [Thermoanaerobaculia bacterium]
MSWRWLVLGLVLVAALAVAVRLVRGSAAEVPTAVVTAGPFVVRVEAEGALQAVRALPLSLPPTAKGAMRIAWLAPDGAPVAAGDVVARFEAEEAEKARDQSRFEVEKSRLSESEEEARSAGSLANLGRDAELARWEADLASRYSSRDPEIFSRREIIESQIDRDLADHKKEHAESLQKTEGERSRLDRELLALERAKNEKILERAESSLSALALTAPQGGIFSLKRSYRGQLPRVGDTVWGSQPLAEIPDLAEMEAEVYVLEADAGRLAVGKRAIVRLESDPERPIAGTILRVGTLAEPIAF